MVSREGCKRFDICSAPLCPSDQGSLEHGLWYSDEESCESVEFRMMPWIKRQRTISKRTRGPDHYFIFKMLERDIIIKKGVCGLDPNKDEPEQLIRWFEAHPERKPLSDAQRGNIIRLIEGSKQYHFKKKVLAA